MFGLVWVMGQVFEVGNRLLVICLSLDAICLWPSDLALEDG